METLDFIDRWIAALRSGDYKQGENALRMPDSDDKNASCFCCLGVACDLIEKDGGGSWIAEPQYQGSMIISGYEFHLRGSPRYNDRSDTLHRSVAKKLKLNRKYKERIWGGESESFQDALIDMNDGHFSFKEIADFIEENIRPMHEERV